HSFRIRGADDLGTKSFHKHDLLDGKALGDRQHNLVAAIAADKREPHTGVSRGGLKYRRTWPQQAFLFGTPNHSQSRPVLDAAAGVQIFKLGVNVSVVRGNNFAEVEHGGITD